MRLDRNKPLGRGKYALVLMRNVSMIHTSYSGNVVVVKSQAADPGAKIIDEGRGDDDFFVIRLKDKFAAPALAAYALAAYPEDPEYALEVLNLAKAAAEHPAKKIPD